MKVLVTVSGPAGSGKTTIAHLIAEYLGTLGVHHSIYETHANTENVMDILKNPEKRIKALKDKGLTVVIEQKQTNRIAVSE